MSSAEASDVYEAPSADLYDVFPETQYNLLSFKGRIGVLGFMGRSFLCTLCLFALVVIFYAAIEMKEDISDMAFGIGTIFFLIAVVPALWIGLTLTAKRLHDLNMSGWHLIFTIIPIFGTLYWLYIALTPGDSEFNRFGQHVPVQTQGWEKPLGKIGLVSMVLFMAASFLIDCYEILASL